jgi:hypothetical protein
VCVHSGAETVRPTLQVFLMLGKVVVLTNSYLGSKIIAR